LRCYLFGEVHTRNGCHSYRNTGSRPKLRELDERLCEFDANLHPGDRQGHDRASKLQIVRSKNNFGDAHQIRYSKNLVCVPEIIFGPVCFSASALTSKNLFLSCISFGPHAHSSGEGRYRPQSNQKGENSK
jgi:hypothetical protein